MLKNRYECFCRHNNEGLLLARDTKYPSVWRAPDNEGLYHVLLTFEKIKKPTYQLFERRTQFYIKTKYFSSEFSRNVNYHMYQTITFRFETLTFIMSPMALLLLVSEPQQITPPSAGIHRCHTAD